MPKADVARAVDRITLCASRRMTNVTKRFTGDEATSAHFAPQLTAVTL
jgi:glycerate kinase